MREVNLRSVDLNLLTVLQALLEERHVTKAAEKLHMSQSAVSRALQRLRMLFNDQLLVKGPDGYDLSNRATSLSAELPPLLQSLSGLIQAPEFDPAEYKGVLRLAGIDLEAWVDMPRFVSQIMSEAPQLKIEISCAQADYFDLLSKGRVDYVVSGFDLEFNQENIHSCLLGRSDLVAIMGKNNPLASQEVTFERYLQAKHGFVSITGKGLTFTDNHLQTLGYTRDVVLKISDFKSVVDYCEATDILFMLPLQLIQSNLAGREVVIKKLPKQLHTPEVEFRLFWHARHHNDPLHQWIKEKIISTKQQSALFTLD